MSYRSTSPPPPSSTGDSYYPPSSLPPPYPQPSPSSQAPHHHDSAVDLLHHQHHESGELRRRHSPADRRHHRGSSDGHDHHSSAERGFFQEPPKLGNQFLVDDAFQRILSLYLPTEAIRPLFHDLSLLGEKVLSSQVLRWVEDAERHPPELETHDAFARRGDSLRTSEGWRKLQELGAQEGCVAEGYEAGLGRMGQFARYYLFCPSSALVTCPFAMTDGAASLLSRHLAPSRPQSQPQSLTTPDYVAPAFSDRELEAESARRVFKRAYNRLVSRFPSVRWTSGQWMTERTGGSDVSRSETTATYVPIVGPPSDKPEGELGPWMINGYKFFSSATDADMTILLARTSGSKGLSAFYAPMRLPNGESNGVRIVRLKKKLGTRAVPTAELELTGMRAWLIGKEGNGIHEISTILNITRVHNAVSAVSFMRRALTVAKAYSRVRVVSRGRPLHRAPLHIRTLAQMELLTRASTHLAFLTVHLLALAENPTSTPPSSVIIPPGSAPRLLRLLTPLTKAVTAKWSLSVISESVEALGGIGYLENEEPLNLARLLRDAQVLSIWEGTTNVLITDMVSAIKRTAPNGGEERTYSVLGEFLRENLGERTGGFEGDAGDVLERCKVAIWAEWEVMERAFDGGSMEELTAAGRRVMWRLAWILVATMLLVDARQDGEGAAVEAVRRWVVDRQGLAQGRIERTPRGGRQSEMEWDTLIVFGNENESKNKGMHGGHML